MSTKVTNRDYIEASLIYFAMIVAAALLTIIFALVF